MLVLSRKPGEKLVIGSDITATVERILGDRVKLGIDAPREVKIVRAELPPEGDEPAVKIGLAE